MAYKQVFKKEDGKPVLITSVFDDEEEKQVFHYDKDKYIDDMPPSELYEPVHYDEEKEKWVGTDYDEYKKNLDKEIEEENN